MMQQSYQSFFGETVKFDALNMLQAENSKSECHVSHVTKSFYIHKRCIKLTKFELFVNAILEAP